MNSDVLVFLWALLMVAETAPVPLQMVDMSYVFDETTLNFPQIRKFKTETVMNGTFENTVWVYYEDYFSGTHVGTHMDAPAHFVPGGRTIDQIPVSSLFAPAAVIDISKKAGLDPDAEIEVEDLLHWERLAGRTLDGHIVLMRSGWGKRWGDPTAYFGTATDDLRQMHSPGMSPSAAKWLVGNRRCPGFGSDAVSLDKGSGSNDGFPTHRILLGAGLFGLENVAHVDRIPICGATLAVLPMKIGKGSGAPTRIVATFPAVSGQQHQQPPGSLFYGRDWGIYGKELAGYGHDFGSAFALGGRKK